MPSTLKKAARFHNRLKLSMNLKSLALTADWSQVLRLRSLLKRQSPRPNVGMGPEIKKHLATLFAQIKKTVKIIFDHLRPLGEDVISSNMDYNPNN